MSKLVFLFALALLTAGCHATTTTNGVPNLVQVNPGVWRSGQPASPAAWVYLKSQGIHTVVKLNFPSEGSDTDAESLGMKVIAVPIQPNGDVTTITDVPDASHIQAAVDALSAGGGVLVHCTHGQDRTGLVVGVYRVQHDHWSKSQAWREMLQRGFHTELLGLDAFWEGVPHPALPRTP